MRSTWHQAPSAPTNQRTTSPGRSRLLATAALCATALFASLLVPPGSQVADAHGSASNPPSRVYSCRFLEPNNSACAAAWQANAQALYDWNEVNIGDVDGRHSERIPDGQLCSAGRQKYAAFNAPGDAWPATQVEPGPFTMTYSATAPHATEYFRLYLTNANFDNDTALKWNDLALVYDSGQLPALSSITINTTLPERSGRHILYLVWQRSDSPEAFYSCNDVEFGPTPDVPTPAVATAAPTQIPQPTTAVLSPTGTPAAAPPIPAPTPIAATPTPAPTAAPTAAPPQSLRPWSPTEAYVWGDIVSHRGMSYRAKWWTRNFTPDQVAGSPWSTPWELVSDEPETGIAWSPDRAYFAGDTAEVNGVTYRAKWWSQGFDPSTQVRHAWLTPWRSTG